MECQYQVLWTFTSWPNQRCKQFGGNYQYWRFIQPTPRLCVGKSWRGIFSAFLVPSSINLNISSVALMAALPIPSHPSIFHLHIQISRWTPPGGGQGQCAQFFIRAHFCKNTNEIRALFCQKYGRKLQHTIQQAHGGVQGSWVWRDGPSGRQVNPEFIAVNKLDYLSFCGI